MKTLGFHERTSTPCSPLSPIPTEDEFACNPSASSSSERPESSGSSGVRKKTRSISIKRRSSANEHFTVLLLGSSRKHQVLPVAMGARRAKDLPSLPLFSLYLAWVSSFLCCVSFCRVLEMNELIKEAFILEKMELKSTYSRRENKRGFFPRGALKTGAVIAAQKLRKAPTKFQK